MATLSLHNVIAKDENVEKEYLKIIGKYENNKKFAELFVITTLALEEKHQDFLGDIFMNAGFGNVRGGQFFTPYHLSKMMSVFCEVMFRRNSWYESSFILQSAATPVVT